VAAFVRFNAVELTRSHWRADVARLLQALGSIGGKRRGHLGARRRPSSKRRRGILGTTAAVALAVAVAAVVLVVSAGNGPTKGTSGGSAQAQDTVAQQHAREVATVLDNCRDPCPPTAVANLGVPIGIGNGLVEVSSGANSISYEVTARSGSGNKFTIQKYVEGQIARRCSQPGTGGCGGDGTW
jgi:hypothetical protein